MNNRLFKCFLFLIGLFFQVNSQAKSNKIFDLPLKPFVLEQSIFHPFFRTNFSTNINFSELLNTGIYFSLTSEIVDGNCYSDNTNTKKVRYTIKNITNSAITIVEKGALSTAGNKIQLLQTDLDFSTFRSIQGNVSISTVAPRFLNAQTIAAGQSLIFEINFSSNSNQNVGAQSIGILNFVYGKSTPGVSIDTSNSTEILERLSTSNNIIRSPNAPSVITKELNPYTNYTLQAAIGFSDAQLINRKFYKNGIEVNPKSRLSNNLVLTSTDILGYTYTSYDNSVVCKESLPSAITFSLVATSNLPNGGTIGVNSLEQCYDSSISITNIANGVSSVTNVSPLSYSWEMSYDGGITWGVAGDVTDEGTTVGTDSGDKTYSLYNVKKGFWIRRKVRERLGNATLRYNYSNVLKIEISKNNILFPTGTTNAVAARLSAGASTAAVSLPVVKTTISNSVIRYYKSDGTLIATNPSGNTLPIGNLTEGEYTYQVTATNTLSTGIVCSTTELIKVIVYNTSNCFSYTKRTPATIVRDWTSGISFVTDRANAVNGNKAIGASLNGGVVLLGIGTVGIDLYFTKPDGTLYRGEELKGKKVTIKIGEQYSGLKVAGGISVIGRLTDNGVTASSVSLTNASNVGATFGVKGGGLDALKGDNVFEYSFVPMSSITSTGVPIAYNGIRIQLGSLLGIADLATVFYAYVEDEGTINGENDITTQQYCQLINQDILVTPPSSLLYPTAQQNTEGVVISGIANQNIKLNRSVEDAFWGNYSEVLNVASSLNPVIYPYYAVDDNYDSFAIFSTTVGALNAQFLQTKLRQIARLGDQVQITLSYPNISIVDLSLFQLGNFKIIYYLDGAKVGEDFLEEFRVLDIGLFRFRDKKRVILSKPADFMFDKLELFQFSVVNVNLGEGLKIYDIRVNPLIAFNTQQDPKSVTEICAASPLIIEKPDDCTTYELSFSRVTRYGVDNYKDANGLDLLDYKGNKIYPIEDFTDLTAEELRNLGINQTIFNSVDYPEQLKAYFNLDLAKLFTGTLYDGKMLIKIQAIRQGCIYGEPQYLRVNFVNCNSAIVNPIIKKTAIY